jgi:hypothetical protein
MRARQWATALDLPSRPFREENAEWMGRLHLFGLLRFPPTHSAKNTEWMGHRARFRRLSSS